MRPDEVESWDDYLVFYTEHLGYTLTNETVREAAEPAAAFKRCTEGCWRYRRLGAGGDDVEVLRLKAQQAEERDCGHPPRAETD